jgi:acyl-coenzyme A synthetase/AMP-(fatty) acid ligase
MILGPPAILRPLTESEFPPEVFEAISQMDAILVGGTAFPKRLNEQFNAKIDAAAKGKRKVTVRQIWGMTEAGMVFMIWKSN